MKFRTVGFSLGKSRNADTAFPSTTRISLTLSCCIRSSEKASFSGIFIYFIVFVAPRQLQGRGQRETSANACSERPARIFVSLRANHNQEGRLAQGSNGPRPPRPGSSRRRKSPWRDEPFPGLGPARPPRQDASFRHPG